MSSGHTKVKRRVWIALTTAVVGVAAWVLWTRDQQPEPTDGMQARQPFVQLAGAGTAREDRLLAERAELLDPTPLFFPTEWNYGQQPLRNSRRNQPGQFFGSFPPKQTIDEQKIGLYGSETPAVPEKLADVLVQGNEAPFAGMGQIERKQAGLPVRSGYLEIRDLKSGHQVINKELSGLLLSRYDFSPVEFLVVVNTAGLMGEPILTAGSGWDEIDSFFRTFLMKSYRLGERLSPGRYRVVIGA